jgi:hypothetical protein
MAGGEPRTTLWPRPRRRRRGLLTWVVVGCLAAVLIEVGAVTSWFGIPALLAGSNSSGPSGTNPNPFGEMVTGVLASITYTTGNRSFPDLQGTDLCAGCPELPLLNRSYDPPVAGIVFYFNVTDEGLNATRLANFTLTASGGNSALFRLVGVACCYPLFEEVVASVYFTAGTTYGFRAYAVASLIPDDGSTGYELYFNSTSP